MANRKHTNVDVSAFRGDAEGYHGDELPSDRYANDKVHLLGRADDHLLDFHAPPIIIRGWQLEVDGGTPGGYKLLPGAGILLNDTGEPVRLETTAEILGLLPVDTTPGAANYIKVVDATIFSEAESSRYDSNTYSKDITPGASVEVSTSYDPDEDILVGVLYPTSTVTDNRLMAQPFRTRDLSGVTGGIDRGEVNYLPNTDLICTSTLSGSVMQPDWWEWNGSQPDVCSPVVSGPLADLPRLDLKLSAGQGIELRLPEYAAGQLDRYDQFVLSLGLLAHADPGNAPIVFELYALTVSWALVGSMELHPQYITEHSQVGLFLAPGSGYMGFKVVIRNPSGSGFSRVYLAEPQLTRGKHMPPALPSSMRKDMVWRYGYSGSIGTGAYLEAAGMAGDHFQLTEPAIITRAWVHAGTAPNGGDHDISIQVDGSQVASFTLGNGESAAAKFLGLGPYPAGSRISIEVSGLSGPGMSAIDVAGSIGLA